MRLGSEDQIHENRVMKITKENIDDVFSKKYTVVKVVAEGCGPCKTYLQFFEDLAEEYSGENINFAELDITDKERIALKELSGRKLIEERIEAIPLLVFYSNKREVNRVVGSNQNQLISDETHRLTSGQYDQLGNQ